MPKYQGYVIRKEYFKVQFDADNLDDARDKIMEVELTSKPIDMDCDFYDIEEIKIPSEAMVMGYALLQKITQMKETITKQSEEITALLKAIKEYERGETNA